jgi:hypothetical protein
MQIWVVATTRNEVDLVRANILHHLSQGIDRFLIVDNDSRDGTQDVLDALAQSSPLEWRRYSGAFRQDLLLTQLAHQARERGADWVIPIDADEFWYAPQATIRTVLEATTGSFLRVQLRNFVQHRDQRYTTPDSLLRMTRAVAQPVGRMEDAEELVERERIAYVEHLYPSKWIHRTSPHLQIGWGNHSISAGASTIDTDEILCLHAPLRSYKVLESKVDIDRPPHEIDAYFTIAWHLRRWRRLAWEGRLEDEWRANSYLDDVLDLNGQHRPVVVDSRLCDLVKPWLI